MPLNPPPLINFSHFGARGNSQIAHDFDAQELWWRDSLHGPVRVLVEQGQQLTEPRIIEVRDCAPTLVRF